MADGLSTTVANAALGNITGTNAAFVQLHTGPPGANGTANVSSVTTRPAQTWNAASGGVITAASTPTWSNWAGTNGEVITDISTWSANAAGTFGLSTTLTTPVTVHTGDTLTLTSQSITLPTAS